MHRRLSSLKLIWLSWEQCYPLCSWSSEMPPAFSFVHVMSLALGFPHSVSSAHDSWPRPLLAMRFLLFWPLFLKIEPYPQYKDQIPWQPRSSWVTYFAIQKWRHLHPVPQSSFLQLVSRRLQRNRDMSAKVCPKDGQLVVQKLEKFITINLLWVYLNGLIRGETRMMWTQDAVTWDLWRGSCWREGIVRHKKDLSATLYTMHEADMFLDVGIYQSVWSMFFFLGGGGI